MQRLCCSSWKKKDRSGQEDNENNRAKKGGRLEGTGCFRLHYPEREIPQNVWLFLNGTGRKKTHYVQTVLRPVPGISSHFGNFSTPDKAAGNTLCPPTVRFFRPVVLVVLLPGPAFSFLRESAEPEMYGEINFRTVRMQLSGRDRHAEREGWHTAGGAAPDAGCFRLLISETEKFQKWQDIPGTGRKTVRTQ